MKTLLSIIEKFKNFEPIPTVKKIIEDLVALSDAISKDGTDNLAAASDETIVSLKTACAEIESDQKFDEIKYDELSLADVAYHALLIFAEIQQCKTEDLDISTQEKIPKKEDRIFVSSGNQFSQSFLKKHVAENHGYDNLKNPRNGNYFSKRDKKTIEDAIQIQALIDGLLKPEEIKALNEKDRRWVWLNVNALHEFICVFHIDDSIHALLQFQGEQRNFLLSYRKRIHDLCQEAVSFDLILQTIFYLDKWEFEYVEKKVSDSMSLNENFLELMQQFVSDTSNPHPTFTSFSECCESYKRELRYELIANFANDKLRSIRFVKNNQLFTYPEFFALSEANRQWVLETREDIIRAIKYLPFECTLPKLLSLSIDTRSIIAKHAEQASWLIEDGINFDRIIVLKPDVLSNILKSRGIRCYHPAIYRAVIRNDIEQAEMKADLERSVLPDLRIAKLIQHKITTEVALSALDNDTLQKVLDYHYLIIDMVETKKVCTFETFVRLNFDVRAIEFFLDLWPTSLKPDTEMVAKKLFSLSVKLRNMILSETDLITLASQFGVSVYSILEMNEAALTELFEEETSGKLWEFSDEARGDAKAKEAVQKIVADIKTKHTPPTVSAYSFAFFNSYDCARNAIADEEQKEFEAICAHA